MTTATAEAMYKALASPETKDLDLEWKVQRAGVGSELYEAKVNLAGIVDVDRDSGVVDALVSVTGIVDEVEDVILPGAYQQTLTERIPKGVWSHDWSTWVSRTDQVGELLPRDTSLPGHWKGKPWPISAGAARVRTAFNLGTQAGKDAFSNIIFFDAGPLGQQVEWSIGYNVPAGQATRNSSGWRLIKALKWYEYCPVLFGAMPLAGTLASKERKDAEMGQQTKETPPVERERIVVTNPPTPADLAAQLKAAVDGVLGTGQQQLDVVGAGWTPSDDELKAAHAAALLEQKVAGREASPSDVRNTDRLKHYWAHGAGAAKIGWGRPGDFERCVHEVGKYIHSPGQVKGYCALRHHEATGFWPGHAPTEQVPGHKGAGDMGDTEHKADGTVVEGKAAPTDPGTAAGSGSPSPEAGATGGQVPASTDEPREDDELDALDDEEDDDPENKWALPFDPPEDYYTGGDEDGTKALEVKASGKMSCGKSAADCPHTMGDDSYPIHDSGELANAVKAYPRGAGKGKTKADIRRHIVKRAKQLGAMSDVPNTFPEKRERKTVEDAIADAIESKDYPYLPGSVEERQDQLRDALRDLLLPEPDAEGRIRAYVSLDATYADRVVATLNDYSTENGEEQTFVIPYTVGDDGEVAFGQPQAVEKVVQLVPDADYDASTGTDADAAAVQPVPAGVLGGSRPLLAIGRKLGQQAKLLEDALGGLDEKAAGDGTHARRLRAAHQALTGALLGMGLDVPAESLPAAPVQATPDAPAGDEQKELLELAARAELLLADA